jgi:citrate lyase beta subunit
MTGDYLQGACLYVPALHRSLESVLFGQAIPQLRLVVVCLEDSTADGDTVQALSKVRRIFRRRKENSHLKIYLRPRSLSMLRSILEWDEKENWDGFVLPKLSLDNIEEWLRTSVVSDHTIMPILETADVFDPYRLSELCEILESGLWYRSIEAIRIGGTDLFAALGIRRPRHMHIYDSIIGPSLRLVACNLMSRGWNVTAPVCEALVHSAVIDDEISLDVEAGFVGKTAISPQQVININNAFRVSTAELLEANTILAGGDAIFRSRDAMCEIAPHTRWAKRVVDRANIFGLCPSETTLTIPAASIV